MFVSLKISVNTWNASRTFILSNWDASECSAGLEQRHLYKSLCTCNRQISSTITESSTFCLLPVTQPPVLLLQSADGKTREAVFLDLWMGGFGMGAIIAKSTNVRLSQLEARSVHRQAHTDYWNVVWSSRFLYYFHWWLRKFSYHGGS
jgi:hypothetical protein